MSDEPDEDRMQAQRREWKRLDDLAAELASGGDAEPDRMPAAVPTPKLVIKPGYQHARRAYELGMDDEYSNAMRNRYGGEW